MPSFDLLAHISNAIKSRCNGQHRQTVATELRPSTQIERGSEGGKVAVIRPRYLKNRSDRNAALKKL